MKKKITIIAILSIVFVFILLVNSKNKDSKILIGHNGSPLISTLYLASEEEDWHETFESIRFKSSSDIAYALLNGDIDVGFVEVTRIGALEKLSGFDDLVVVGKITFPYGATLIINKDIDVRLNEIDGFTIGISEEKCKLLEAFQDDAKRLGVDISNINYKILPFDSMIPALEAGEIDGAITKGIYGVIGKNQGHNILYQNWEVEPGDDCCPAVIDQTELVLLARKNNKEGMILLPQRLMEAQEKGSDKLKKAIVKNTMIKEDIVSDFPVAEFSFADNSLIEIFLDHDH